MDLRCNEDFNEIYSSIKYPQKDFEQTFYDFLLKEDPQKALEVQFEKQYKKNAENFEHDKKIWFEAIDSNDFLTINKLYKKWGQPILIVKNVNGKTAIEIACLFNYSYLVLQLLSFGADPKTKIGPESQELSLMELAIVNLNLDMVKSIVFFDKDLQIQSYLNWAEWLYNTIQIDNKLTNKFKNLYKNEKLHNIIVFLRQNNFNDKLKPLEF